MGTKEKTNESITEDRTGGGEERNAAGW